MISFLAAILIILANLVFTNILIIKKFNKPILYNITDGIFALHISRDIVPDLETANTDFFKIWFLILLSFITSQFFKSSFLKYDLIIALKKHWLRKEF